jgi:hypothetical protein
MTSGSEEVGGCTLLIEVDCDEGLDLTTFKEIPSFNGTDLVFLKIPKVCARFGIWSISGMCDWLRAKKKRGQNMTLLLYPLTCNMFSVLHIYSYMLSK